MALTPVFGAHVLEPSTTKIETFSGANQILLPDAIRDLIVTLDITVADRADADEDYDFYITTGDNVSSWDVIHFPQIATTGAKRFTARVSGLLLPQNVTTAGPGVTAVDTATLLTGVAGADQGIKTLAAGSVRHGPLGNFLNYELVIAGTTPSITYSISMFARAHF